MAATPIGNGAVQSAVTLSGFTTIASGGFQASSAFTVPALSGATGSYVWEANLQFSMTSATPVAGDAIQLCILTADDGTNFDAAWVTGSGQSTLLYPQDATFFVYPLQAAATTFVRIKGLYIPTTPVGAYAKLVMAAATSSISLASITSAALYPSGGSAG